MNSSADGGRTGRRALLAGVALALAAPRRLAEAVDAHGRVGPVRPPVAVPDCAVVTSDGQARRLRDLLAGRVTAIQLMFSQCRSICPVEAATFARVQEALGDDLAGRIRLLSLSIDPATDTPPVLRAWLRRFGARAGWDAAAPAPADLASMRRFFDNGSGLGEDHATAMEVIDADARLVWRSAELPAPEDVARVLVGLDRAQAARVRDGAGAL